MEHTNPRAWALTVVLAALAATPALAADGPGGQPQTAYQVESAADAAGVEALAARVETDPAYKEAGCIALQSGYAGQGAFADYLCANPSAASDALFRQAADAGMSLYSTTAVCPSGCYLTYCPWPNIQCCNIYTHAPCGL